jgi:hypothetical protein
MADDLDVVMGPARQDDAEEMVVVRLTTALLSKR